MIRDDEHAMTFWEWFSRPSDRRLRWFVFGTWSLISGWILNWLIFR